MKKKKYYVFGVVLLFLLVFMSLSWNSKEKPKEEIPVEESSILEKKKEINKVEEKEKKKPIEENPKDTQPSIKQEQETLQPKQEKRKRSILPKVDQKDEVVISKEEVKEEVEIQHSHDFRYIEPIVEKVIDIPYQPGWQEPIYETKVIYQCNGCGIIHAGYEEALNHMNVYMLMSDMSHTYSDNTTTEIVGYITHDAIQEQSHEIVIVEGYYICDCGVIK